MPTAHPQTTMSLLNTGKNTRLIVAQQRRFAAEDSRRYNANMLRFTKMNGAGNDFVLLDNRSGDLSNVLDAISQGVQTIQTANDGITAITSLLQQAQSVAQQALHRALLKMQSHLGGRSCGEIGQIFMLR